MLRIGTEGKYQMAGIQAQLGAVQQQGAEKGKEVQAARAQEQATQKRVEAVKSEKLGTEAILRASDEVLAATERRKAPEQALAEIQQKTIDLQKSGLAASLQIEQSRGRYR